MPVNPPPLPPVQLLIARHGQTDLNIDERWQGRLDLPLNATGQAQAQALCAQLPPGIEVLVCSPQLRARQTAAPAAQALGLPVQLDARFRERDFGLFEGLSLAEARLRHPGLVAESAAYSWTTEPPGAEPTRAVVQRVALGLADLRRQHAGRTVLLVVHGFVIRCLRHLIDAVPEDRFFSEPRVPNGALLQRVLR